jgi:hypothetical protein
MVSNPGLQCEIELLEDTKYTMMLRTSITNIGKNDIRFNYPNDFADSLILMNIIAIVTNDSVYRFKNEMQQLEYYKYEMEDSIIRLESKNEKRFFLLKSSQALVFTMSLAQYHDILNFSEGKYSIKFYSRFPVVDANYMQVTGYPSSYTKRQKKNSTQRPLFYAVFSNTLYFGEWKN